MQSSGINEIVERHRNAFKYKYWVFGKCLDYFRERNGFELSSTNTQIEFPFNEIGLIMGKLAGADCSWLKTGIANPLLI